MALATITTQSLAEELDLIALSENIDVPTSQHVRDRNYRDCIARQQNLASRGGTDFQRTDSCITEAKLLIESAPASIQRQLEDVRRANVARQQQVEEDRAEVTEERARAARSEQDYPAGDAAAKRDLMTLANCVERSKTATAEPSQAVRLCIDHLALSQADMEAIIALTRTER